MDSSGVSLTNFVADSARGAHLRAVKALSEAMVDSARRGDWQRVVELERQRRDDMVASFEDPIVGDEALQVRDALQAVMGLNLQLTEMVKQARQDSLQQFQSLQSGQRAAQAYQAVSDS